MPPLQQELAALRHLQVWLGLGITVFGVAGVFALYTYIEPLLTQVTRMAGSLVALTLLLFGAGLAAGNLPALAWSLVALLVVLALGRRAFGYPGVAMAYVVMLGIVAFATVAPMQMRGLSQAGPQGVNLVSSLNIAAFNLGWTAAALTAVGLVLTFWSSRLPGRAGVELLPI